MRDITKRIGPGRELDISYRKTIVNTSLHYPDYCKDGWKVTLAGSRFLHGADERYAPEGIWSNPNISPRAAAISLS